MKGSSDILSFVAGNLNVMKLTCDDNHAAWAWFDSVAGQVQKK